MTQFIIEFLQRLKSRSPAFFFKIRIAMIISGAIITCIQLLLIYKAVHVTSQLYSILTNVLNQALVIIGTVTGVSFLPTTDPKLIGDDVKVAVIKQAVEENSPALREALLSRVKDNFQQN